LATFFVYTVVLLAAMAYRRRRRDEGEWADFDNKGFARPTSYFRLALIALVTGFGVTFAWQALLFGVISVPSTGPNWLHLVTLSMAQSLRPPVVAVLIALLADRKEALIDRKGSLAVILASCAFFMFLSGFIAGDVMEAIMANVAAGGSERAVVTREQWVDAFESGLLGLWIILILMIAQLPQLRQAWLTALSRTLLRFNRL
jgi:amino acid transporter